MEVKDSNGTIINEGDSVQVIKTLKVKGTQITLKQGTVIKNVHLTDDGDEVEVRVEKTKIVLRTEFLKRKG